MNRRKIIRGKGWKRPIRIASDKFETISEAILGVLTENPIKFGELVELVKKRVKNFPGSVAWYTITSLRELEASGKVERVKGKGVGYRQIKK